MKGTPHLVLSSIPLQKGRDQDALCGRTIVKAVPVFEEIVDGDLRVLAQMTLRICGKCTARFFGMPKEEFARASYVYGVMPAMEVKAQDWEEAS